MPIKPKTLNYAPADEDTNGFADDVNAASGEALALAATVSGDDLAHRVVITPSGAVTGDYTITGLDPDGKPQTETLATDTVNAVTSVGYYSELTEVLAPSGIGAETVDIGWADEFASKTLPLDLYCSQTTIATDISGTIDYDVQKCYERPTAGETPNWITITTPDFDGATTDVQGTLAESIGALRLVGNSYSSGATAAMRVIQPRYS